MPSPAFEKASKDSRHLKAKPTNEELLELYALFKVAHKEDFSKAPAPGMFDLKGKAKHKAWGNQVEAKTTPADAEKRYIALVQKLKTSYGFDPTKETAAA